MIKYNNQNLLIPLYDIRGKLWSLQIIFPNGSKRFLSGGRKKGCFYIVGFSRIHEVDKLFIAEGYATAMSIYMVTNIPVICCFDAGNIKPVIAEIRRKYINHELIIAADNDCYSTINIGLEKAKEAASIFGIKYVVPKFQDKSSRPTDYNDLYCLEGINEVRRQLNIILMER